MSPAPYPLPLVLDSWLSQLNDWDAQLFLFLNGLHAPWLDVAMYWITDRFFWIPLYIFITVWTYRRYGLPGFWLILAAGASVALADQVTSNFMKPYFGRLRPCYNPSIQEQVFVLRGCGGRYGFASSHAATTFALATSAWLYTRRVARQVWVMFLWAALVSYSRIYVGVHYPLDLLGGALVGTLCALILYGIYRFTLLRFSYQLKPIEKKEAENILD